MVEQNILSVGFLDREPRSAARTLETINPITAAAFLNQVPVRLAIPAVSAMSPWCAARCTQLMDRETASALVMGMPHVDAVSILRLVDGTARNEILELSSDRFAKGFRNTIRYRRDTVGAWMDISMRSFEATSKVRETLNELRQMNIAQSHLFLTGSDHQYLGVVSVMDLLRHDESALLDALADRSVKPLSNQAPLVNCSASPNWDELSVLPVVGRRRNLLGGLSRVALRKGLGEPAAPVRALDHSAMITQMGSAFVAVAAECANLALAMRQDRLGTQTAEE